MTPAKPRAAAPRIVALIGPGPLPWIIVNALVEQFGPMVVIEEQKEPSSRFFKRRIRRLGVVPVAGQLGYGVLQKFIARFSERRKQQIIEEFGLSTAPNTLCAIRSVESVNSDACRFALKAAEPDVVVVAGTRMIDTQTLKCVKAPFINYHAGINPKYRGMYGGYWAVANRDLEHAGVTAHLVDEGVDTGQVLYQSRFRPTPRDNAVTYFHLQAAAGRKPMIRAVKAALAGQLRSTTSSLPSKQWFHPTVWRYVYNGLVRGVW